MKNVFYLFISSLFVSCSTLDLQNSTTANIETHSLIQEESALIEVIYKKGNQEIFKTDIDAKKRDYSYSSVGVFKFDGIKRTYYSAGVRVKGFHDSLVVLDFMFCRKRFILNKSDDDFAPIIGIHDCKNEINREIVLKKKSNYKLIDKKGFPGHVEIKLISINLSSELEPISEKSENENSLKRVMRYAENK